MPRPTTELRGEARGARLLLWSAGLGVTWLWSAFWIFTDPFWGYGALCAVAACACSFPTVVGFSGRGRAWLRGGAAALAASLGVVGMLLWQALPTAPDRAFAGSFTLVVIALCAAVGGAFGAIGRSCQHKGRADGRAAVAVVSALPLAACLTLMLSAHVSRSRRVVVRFPATQVYGVPVAIAALPAPNEFVWAAVPPDGRSVHMFRAHLSGDVKADVQLAAPQLIGSLKSPRARFDASATFLVAATPNGIVVWNHRTGEIVWSLSPSEQTQVTAVALSPCAPRLIYATAEPVDVHLVNLEKPLESTALAPRATAPVCSFSFHPNGKLFVAGTGDPDRRDRTVGGEIIVIDVPQWKLNGVIDIRVKRGKYLPQSPPRGMGITSVALHMGCPNFDTPPSVLATMDRVESDVICFYLDGTWNGTGLWSRSLKTACHFSVDSCGLALGDAGGWVYVRTASPIDGFPDEARMTLVARSIQPVELLRFLPDSNHLAANEFVLSVKEILGWPGNPFRQERSGDGQQ